MAGGKATITALGVLGAGYAITWVPVTVDDPSHTEPVADGYMYAGPPAAVRGRRWRFANNPNLGNGYERISYLTFPADRYGCGVTRAVLYLHGVIASGTEQTPLTPSGLSTAIGRKDH